MKWSNLKNNKCPQCNRDFTKGLNVKSNMQPTMFTHLCGFKITEQRYKEIVSDMVEKKIDEAKELSNCCNSPLVGGVQCENCGSDGQ